MLARNERIGSPPVGPLRIAVALIHLQLARLALRRLVRGVSSLIDCRSGDWEHCCRCATDAVHAISAICAIACARCAEKSRNFLWIMSRCKFCSSHETTLVEFRVSGDVGGTRNVQNIFRRRSFPRSSMIGRASRFARHVCRALRQNDMAYAGNIPFAIVPNSRVSATSGRASGWHDRRGREPRSMSPWMGTVISISASSRGSRAFVAQHGRELICIPGSFMFTSIAEAATSR